MTHINEAKKAKLINEALKLTEKMEKLLTSVDIKLQAKKRLQQAA